jgi:hypothetical protein
MDRRVMIAVLAAMGLVAMWWTEAVAATCLQYRTIGGSSVCCKWSTKGVQVEVDFNQACGTFGENCSANATAVTTDSIAFCQNTSTGVITRRECTNQVTFNGSSGECVPKHDLQDVDPTFPGEPGHEHHGCTANFVLTASSCASCCQTAETCVDVTPVEMDTSITAFVSFGGEDFVAQSTEGGPGCSSGSSFSSCTWEEHCSINPKKIELNGEREYQCNLEAVFNGGGD